MNEHVLCFWFTSLQMGRQDVDYVWGGWGTMWVVSHLAELLKQLKQQAACYWPWCVCVCVCICYFWVVRIKGSQATFPPKWFNYDKDRWCGLYGLSDFTHEVQWCGCSHVCMVGLHTIFLQLLCFSWSEAFVITGHVKDLFMQTELHNGLEVFDC